MVTLYGRGAISVHDDKDTYRPHNGSITVPPHLVPAVVALGWTRDKRNLVEDAVLQVDDNKMAKITDLRKTRSMGTTEQQLFPDGAPLVREKIEALSLAVLDLQTAPEGED